VPAPPLAAHPWDGIALARTRPAREVRADFAAARENPCLSCETSPCCWYLPLQTFEPSTYLDVDGLYKLLLFERIELGLSSSGTWSAYYVHPCRFLDRETHLCQVHATDLQPKTCVYYKPFGCWYRRVLSGPATEEYVRVDLRRFREIVALYRFDDNRRVVATPPWPRVLEICAAALAGDIEDGLPQQPSAEVVVEDPALARPPAEPGGADFVDCLADPCEPCPAPCCTYLSFPMGRPETFMSLDFMRFTLGFPGAELGVSDDTWWLTIAARCRHLDPAGRCAVYGQPERPLACGYYNQWSCGFRREFLEALPPGFARVRYEHLPMLTALFDFDRDGRVTHLPEVAEVHAALLQSWRELIVPPDNGAAAPRASAATGPNGRPVIEFLTPAPGSEAWRLAVGG